ncbi:substrate-binding domain-containing protein [Acidicapsa ligni]|uniref:substrate-binding domain-containing protein n=1 Tax=Acidicapsa ligni TaxID=542300 RepID=UPI0021DF55CD|nr:substrate-binding domain-containing protein [Acidicapsa ligni]
MHASKKADSSRKTTKRLYLIPILSKALDIMELLQAEKAPMALEAVYQRTKFSKTTVYRVLQTLAHRGYISRTSDGLYRHVNAPAKLRFGFGSQSSDMPFSEAVTESMRVSTAASGVDLIVLDNRYDGATALKNADEFIKAKVDLIIEFQIDRRAAPVIGDKVAAAGIPLIAIDNPHPHATYFGVDNYRAGLEAGELLATYATEQWGEKVDWVLGLDLEEAGTLVQSRITGSLDGVHSMLPQIQPDRFVRIDGRGMREKSQRVVAEFLARHAKDKHILIAAATDTSALGALEAVREAKRERQVAIVGQDCIPEVVEEMRRTGSPIIGSVSHEVHEYGPRIIELGLSILQGRSVPPYNYVNHKTITQKMVRQRIKV